MVINVLYEQSRHNRRESFIVGCMISDCSPKLRASPHMLRLMKSVLDVGGRGDT